MTVSWNLDPIMQCDELKMTINSNDKARPAACQSFNKIRRCGCYVAHLTLDLDSGVLGYRKLMQPQPSPERRHNHVLLKEC